MSNESFHNTQNTLEKIFCRREEVCVIATKVANASLCNEGQGWAQEWWKEGWKMTELVTVITTQLDQQGTIIVVIVQYATS